MKPVNTSSQLFVNGSVYSPADPFATALLVEGSTVAWLGSDRAARVMAGERATVSDLDAAVVTPAFVAHQWVGEEPVTPAQGYGAVELLSADGPALEAAVTAAGDAGLVPLPVLVRTARDAEQVESAHAPRPVLGCDLTQHCQDVDALRDTARGHLVACTRVQYQAVLVVGTQGAPATSEVLEAVLDAVDEATRITGERPLRARGHRVVGIGLAQAQQCERLAGHALSVTAEPAAAPMAELLRVGVSVTVATRAPNPWSAVKEVLEAPEASHRTSARAAFLAMTRGAWRAHRDASPMTGQLVPGAEATLAVWRAESLMVQQPEGVGASWSTDPRGRTPALPSLDDQQLPACEGTWVRGVKHG